MSRGRGLAVLAAVAAVAVSAACGGSGNDSGTLSEADSAALDRVKASVVRIEAEGTFADPESGAQSAVAGTGSGFVVDPSGLAVTNNHVVSGSALLRVNVGDEEEPRNARVVGVSECSDLAVIQIEGDEEEGFPFLQWEPEAVGVGTEVYAAGYPLGDSEFTLTRGIVSKESADGETPWASVDTVLEHDATINPGSSGGPLLSEAGKVVGVNYASRPAARQYFAIGEGEAQSVLDRLSGGDDVTSIGINARAVLNSETGNSGVWVSSVESGSPADETGVRPGDIVLQLENLPVGRGGTLSDYCDVIRSKQKSDPVAIQVLRPSANAILEGRLNGAELKRSFSFGQQATDTVSESDSGETAYTRFRRVSDRTGAITVKIPAQWRDIDGRPQAIGPTIIASPSIARANAYREAGIGIFVTDRAGGSDVSEVLTAVDAEVRGDCAASSSAREYARGRFRGQFRVYTECKGTDTTAVVASAAPASGDYLVVIALQATSRRDLEALDSVLDSIGVRPSRF